MSKQGREREGSADSFVLGQQGSFPRPMLRLWPHLTLSLNVYSTAMQTSIQSPVPFFYPSWLFHMQWLPFGLSIAAAIYFWRWKKKQLIIMPEKDA